MMRRSLAVSLATLCLPAAEILFFRLWLHHGLQLRLGLPGFVDFDLLFPCVFAFCLFTLLLTRERPIELKLQKLNLGLNIASVALFATISTQFRSIQVAQGLQTVTTLWTASLILMILSAFAVLVPFRYVLTHPKRWTVVPCLLIASTLVIVKHLYSAVWPWFGAASAEAVCSIMQTVEPATTCGWKSAYYFYIRHPDLKVLFGPPCSGTDGLLLFLIGFSLFVSMDSQGLSRWKTMVLFVMGIGYAFALNVARVVAVFGLSIGTNAVLESKVWGIRILAAFFHSHAGWALYAVGWTFFFWMVYQAKELSLLSRSTLDDSHLAQHRQTL